MPTQVRLIIEDSPCDGPTNMARDEVLLEQAIRFGIPTMRWYQWSPATLSLGYFQQDDGTLPELPRVRRLSGGGAILHANEWTYSIAAPKDIFGAPRSLYADVHRAIVATMLEHGIPAAMRGVEEDEKNGAFLCFERGDQHDILLTAGRHSGRKIVGSAQRRRGSGVLQHGSIHYDLNVPAGESGRRDRTLMDCVTKKALIRGVCSRLGQQKKVDWNESALSQLEVEATTNWAQTKYFETEWSRDLRRGPADIPAPDGFPGFTACSAIGAGQSG